MSRAEDSTGPATRATRWLGAGAAGLVLFLVWITVEGARRPGYRPWRHAVSQLSLGPGGWLNVVAMTLAAVSFCGLAVGLRRQLPPSGARLWIPRLMVVVGGCFLVMVVFPIDPGLGYPPHATASHSVEGLLHGLAGTAAFAALATSCFVFSRHRRERERPIWARRSFLAGAVVAAGYVATGLLTGLDQAGVLPDAPAGLAQRISIGAGFGWLVLVAWRHAAHPRPVLRVVVPGSATLACLVALNLDPGQAMWTHSIHLGVPLEVAWPRLSSMPLGRTAVSAAPPALHLGATLHQAQDIHVAGDGTDFAVTVTTGPSSHLVKVKVDPSTHRVTVEGQWWFRGVLALESPGASRCRLVLHAYNIARWPGRLLVPMVSRGVREQTHKDLGTIAHLLDDPQPLRSDE